MAVAMKKLAVYATLAVLVHALVVVWYLFVLSKIPLGITGQPALMLTIALNVLPFAGLVLLWAHHPRLASVLIFVSLAIAFLVGGFEHFLSEGPENVLRMAFTDRTILLTTGAVLLAMLEVCGCWLCVRLFGKSGSGQLQN